MMRRPSAIGVSTVQDFTGISSSHTTQTPQLEVSQPQCEPVRPSSSRRKWMSSSRGSTSRTCSTPFTTTVTFTPPPREPARPPAAAPGW